ncbi:MAG: PilC/PilY family type IV pilus protein [Gammaproteobacteria bacterium]
MPPFAGRHPTKANGFMVYFGTGKYIEGPDIDAKPTGQTTQTFYGVWDENISNPSTTLGRTNLLKQEIVKPIFDSCKNIVLPNQLDTKASGRRGTMEAETKQRGMRDARPPVRVVAPWEEAPRPSPA